VLSTRVDLLPPEYVAELARLQDSARPLSAEVIRETIEGDLGRALDRVFLRFDEAPLAAASIGQVHSAMLLDGAEVAVKARRPGVVERIREDLEILRTLAGTASRRSRLAADYDLVALVDEFSQTLRGETDYLREARNAERFRIAFESTPWLRVPRVVWEATGERVLTLERVTGIKIDDLEALDARRIDRRLVAERDAAMVLTMVLRDGFFHADPHPGNFFVEDDASIGMVDFGMVGRIDERLQDQLAWALLAFSGSDLERQIDVLYELGIARPRTDREALRRDLAQMRTRYVGRTLGEIQVRQAAGDAIAFARRHRLQLPASLALLAKTLAMHEGLVRRLDPEFDLSATLQDYGRKVSLRQLSPGVLGRWLAEGVLDWGRLSLELPQRLRRLMSLAERGDLEIAMRPSSFEPVLRRAERMVRMLIAGVIVAAAIIAAAVVVAALAHR
jgi:ubiquinone biosynthesis protein